MRNFKPLMTLLLATALTQGFCDSNCCPEERSDPRSVVDVKVGYFFFADETMRDVYEAGGIDLQLSGSFKVWRWLQLYGSVEYFQKDGKSLGGGQRTSIWGVPLSLGLRPVFKVSSMVDYYFTLGPRYFFVHAHNKSSFVSKNMNSNGLGGFVNTGFNFFPYEHLAIDVFGEYSYKRLNFHSKGNTHGKTVQVGGFAFGVGLGYAF